MNPETAHPDKALAKLKEIIFDRIPIEIFLAHEALGIYRAISLGSDSLGRSGHSHVFGIIQRQALDAFVLSLCKLFEKPSQKYPNYSIHMALVHFSALGDEDRPVELPVKVMKFIRSEIGSTISSLDLLSTATAAQKVHSHFQELCSRTPLRESKKLDRTLAVLKVLRDRRVAHHEDHDLVGLSTTDLDSAVELLYFAQTFVNIIGYGFFGFSGKTSAQSSEFVLDESRGGSQMKQMIQEVENAF